MSVVLILLLGLPDNIGNPREEIQCPRWISEDSEVTVPNDVSISPEQAKRNNLRCDWSVVKAAERTCNSSTTKGLSEARTP